MAGGMWCAWHFSAKGQLSGRRWQRSGEEGEITAAGAHSSLFSVSITQSIFLLHVSRSLYLSRDLALSLLDNSLFFLGLSISS